jgi:hypothetical protein
MSAGVVPSSEYLIATSIVDNFYTNSVTFNNLAQYSGVYKHLKIIASVKTVRNETFDALGLRINGISSVSYSAHYLAGDGVSVFSASETPSNRILVGNPEAAAGTDNVFSAHDIEILDAFSTTKNTVVRAISGCPASRPRIFFHSGAWIDTAAINSITLFSTTIHDFNMNSRFSLYGVTA